MITKAEAAAFEAIRAGEEKKDIFFTGNIWHELYPKVDPGIFWEALLEHIDLSKYGPGVKEIYFAFVTLDDFLLDAFSHWIDCKYIKKKSAVEIGMELPYEQVVEGTKEEVVRMMEQALLEGIEVIGSFKLNAPFDHQAFRKDVEAIFSDPDWWVEADPSSEGSEGA